MVSRLLRDPWSAFFSRRETTSPDSDRLPARWWPKKQHQACTNPMDRARPKPKISPRRVPSRRVGSARPGPVRLARGGLIMDLNGFQGRSTDTLSATSRANHAAAPGWSGGSGSAGAGVTGAGDDSAPVLRRRTKSQISDSADPHRGARPQAGGAESRSAFAMQQPFPGHEAGRLGGYGARSASPLTARTTADDPQRCCRTPNIAM